MILMTTLKNPAMCAEFERKRGNQERVMEHLQKPTPCDKGNAGTGWAGVTQSSYKKAECRPLAIHTPHPLVLHPYSCPRLSPPNFRQCLTRCINKLSQRTPLILPLHCTPLIVRILLTHPEPGITLGRHWVPGNVFCAAREGKR